MKNVKSKYSKYRCSASMSAKIVYDSTLPVFNHYLSPTTPYRRLFNYRLARKLCMSKKVRF